MVEELLLEVLVGEVLPELQRRAADVVFAPVAEADLEERDARILVVALREIGVEAQGERLQRVVAPVGVPGRAVAAGIGGVGFLVAVQLLDVVGNGGLPLVRLPADLRVVRVFVDEPDDRLVVARLDVVQQRFEPGPVVFDRAVGVPPLHHLVGPAVGVLQRDRVPVGGELAVVRPEDEPGHRERLRDFGLQRNRAPDEVAVVLRRGGDRFGGVRVLGVPALRAAVGVPAGIPARGGARVGGAFGGREFFGAVAFGPGRRGVVAAGGQEERGGEGDQELGLLHSAHPLENVLLSPGRPGTGSDGRGGCGRTRWPASGRRSRGSSRSPSRRAAAP